MLIAARCPSSSAPSVRYMVNSVTPRFYETTYNILVTYRPYGTKEGAFSCYKHIVPTGLGESGPCCYKHIVLKERAVCPNTGSKEGYFCAAVEAISCVQKLHTPQGVIVLDLTC